MSVTPSTPTSDLRTREAPAAGPPPQAPPTPVRDLRSAEEPAAGRPAPPAHRIERVPWSLLGPRFIEQWGFRHGKPFPEHVEIVGPTGSGKSLLKRVILKERARRRGTPTIIIVCKRRDETLSTMGWPITSDMSDLRKHPQLIFWPRTKALGDEAIEYHRKKVKALLDYVWANSSKQSSEILDFDEVMYVQEELELKSQIEHFLREARSHGITLVLEKQRLQGVTREMHAETSWKFIFDMNDEDDNDRAADLLGPRRVWRPVIQDLDRMKHEFVVQHKYTKETYISWVDKAYIQRQRQLEEAARANTVRR